MFCFDIVKKYWPNLPKSAYPTLLFECTAYPAGDAEQVEAQIKRMAEESGQDLKKAMEISYRELDEEMAKFHAKEDGKTE